VSECLRVALPVPLRRTYDYTLPAGTPAIRPGMRVRVPFGNRRLVGFVVDAGVTPDIDPAKLRPAEEALDVSPLWPETVWQLLHWASFYYQHPIGEVLAHAAPAALRQGQKADYGSVSYWQPTAEGQSIELEQLKRAPKQQQLLAALRRKKLTNAECAAEDYSTAARKALADKGLIEQCEDSLQPEPWAYASGEKPHRLNQEQALALGAMQGPVAERKAKVWLLEGVTGSGKTEVYLQAMEPVLKRGQQVLVMVPEIGLTPQTVSRFRARFDVPVVVLHSGLSDQERLRAWLQARDGCAAIIIGTRSAIFTPCKSLGLVIIDEEHDLSFKQQDGFRYNARDLAVKRAYQEGFGVILGSATPSLESLDNATSGKYHYLQLKQRAGGASQAKSYLLDLKQQRMQSGLSDQLVTVMNKHLDAGNQVLLFLNRRGYAPALLCHECGWIAECPRCQANMTVHQGRGELHCHHCGTQHRIPNQCHSCGSTQLISRGVGTEQLEQTIAQHFPEKPVVRIDRDSTRRKGQLEQFLEDAAAGKYPILIGTQMLAKGHHFPNVTLVALLDVDGALYSSDFRAAERLAQLYVQVAGRAGRASKPGTVVLQTHHPEHPLIQELVNNGYHDFARSALEERKQALLPPYAAMALLRASAVKERDAEALLQEAANVLEGADEVTVIGPMPAPLARRAGRYRFQLLLHAESRSVLHQWLNQRLPLLEQLPQGKKARWSLDIDPQDFT